MTDSKPFKVRAEARDSTSPYFTDGKVYEARPKVERARTYVVQDDAGNARVIMLDGPCPHWTWFSNPERRGRFVRVDPVVEASDEPAS